MAAGHGSGGAEDTMDAPERTRRRPEWRSAALASLALVALAAGGCASGTTGIAESGASGAADRSAASTSDPPPGASSSAPTTAPDTTAAPATTAAPTTATIAPTTATTLAPQLTFPGDGLAIRRDERIRFARGAIGATVENVVVRGERDRYRLEASAGQVMSVFLSSPEDNAVFDLFDPAGRLLASEVTVTRVELPADGDYYVIVGGTRGNAGYALTVEIL